MTTIIGFYSEDFMLLKTKKMFYSRIHSLDYCAGRNEDGLYVWLFTVFSSIFDRINSSTCSSSWMDSIHIVLINSWTDRKYPRQTSLVSYVNVQYAKVNVYLLLCFCFLRIATKLSLSLFIYLYRACTTSCDKNRWRDTDRDKIDFA